MVRNASLPIECPSPRRSGEKVPKADEGLTRRSRTPHPRFADLLPVRGEKDSRLKSTAFDSFLEAAKTAKDLKIREREFDPSSIRVA